MAITTTNTITPLMMATSVSMESIPGLDVNTELNDTVLVYEQTTHEPASTLGAALDGTLKSDGDDVYTEFYVTDIIPGAADQTFTNPDGTTTYGNVRLVRNYLGKLSSVMPDGWVYDGNLYRGSLSAFGGQVAYRISPGFLSPTYLEQDKTPTIGANGESYYGWHVVQRTPTYDGKYVPYYGDPKTQTLGADTIPALTQTVPASVTGISGSLMYWMDQAISRPLGKTKVTEQSYLFRLMGLAQGFVARSNRYLQATRNSEKYSLRDLGYASYQELIGQGWLKYQQGQAIKLALKNIGSMITASIVGLFGTPAGVAFVLINSGLGNIGKIVEKLTAQDVVLADIGNPIYESRIAKVLSEITDPTTLSLIQEGVGSTVPNMTSALDYIYIDKCAGMNNDSAFESFADVGTDLRVKTLYLSAETGADLIPIIDGVRATYNATVESQAGPNSLLKPEITNLFRSRLPVSANDTNITLLDVIGSPCGYYNEQLAAVNQGIQALEESYWGPQIRTALKNITAAASSIMPFTEQGYLPNVENVDQLTGYNNQAAVDSAVNDYNQLMVQILNDPSMTTIVEKINSNYLIVAQRVALETHNKTKLKTIKNIFTDDFDTMDLASSLHSYAVDAQGQQTNTYITGLIQKNATGDLIRATMEEGYNYNLISTVNIAPNGFVA